MKLHRVFILTIILLTALEGCANLQPTEKPAMLSDFAGTWERVNGISKNTLTITSTTLKASNQNYFWNLSSVSGDIYTIYPSPNPGLKGTVRLKLVGDYLEIIDAYDMPNAGAWSGSEDDWTGTWKIR